MEENELYDRIGETDLNPTYKDGQPYMHTDINQMLGILKTAINENYYDIQRLLNGVKTVGNAKKIDDATLSRYIDEELQADDDKIPSSQQAKAYMDTLFAGYSAPVRGVDYWTEADQQQIVSDTASNVIEEITPDLEEALAAKANINDIPTKVSDLTNDSEFVEKSVVDKKSYYFNNVLDMKAYNLSEGDFVLINNSSYSIIDTENATNVNMTFNSTKNRYELLGVSSQNGIPSINNPVNFEDTYTSGMYKTTINNKVYVFELTDSLKSLNNIQDIFWIDTVNETMGIDKNVNEVVLNGTEGWEQVDNTSYSNSILRFSTKLYTDVFYKSSTAYISSDRLEGVYLGTRTQNAIARQLDTSGLNIFIDKSNLETEDVEGLVNLLNSNNILARYRTLVTISSEYDDITLNNGLLAKKIKEQDNSYIQKTILDYKDYVVDGDWLPAFNRALAENVKSLHVPTGVYNISDTFTVTNGMKIYGDGIANTVIRLVNFSDNANAIIEFYYSDYSSIEDISLSSLTYGAELIAGLYIHFSDKLFLNNVSISNVNGTGLYLQFEGSGNTSYDCKINNMDIHDCNGHGFHLAATDLFLSNCVAYRVKKHGFYFTKSNSLLVNCKAYWTGEQGDETTGDGFYLKTDNYSTSKPSNIGHKTRLVNCEAQECGRYGFSLINTDSCQLIGCQCDTNGMYCENITAYGYYLRNNRDLKLIGVVTNQNLVGWHKVPLYFDGGYNNNIQILAQLLEYGTAYYKFFDDLYTVLNYNPSNEIYVNNYQVNKSDYKNDLYNYDNTTGTANDFTFTKVGQSTATHEIDFNTKSQKLTLEYASGSSADNNAKIYQDFNVSSDNFNKISMSVLTKNSNLYVGEFIRFRFYDSNNTELYNKTSAFNLYDDARDNKHLHWHTLYLDFEIPSNTTRVRVELFTALQSSGVTAQQGGSTWFKDFKLCCYNQNS